MIKKMVYCKCGNEGKNLKGIWVGHDSTVHKNKNGVVYRLPGAEFVCFECLGDD